MRFGIRPCLFQQSDQQSLGSVGIAVGLDDLVKNVTVLVNGAPKPMLSATDGDQDLVQVPDVLSRRLLSAQLLHESRPEFAASSPDRFVRHHNAALQQHFLDQP